jgi:hypothetical protein
MNKYWFTPKNYGCGFYPSSWEGWVIILFTCALICLSFYTHISFEEQSIVATRKNWLSFLVDFIVIYAVYFILVKDKVAGGVKWRRKIKGNNF